MRMRLFVMAEEQTRLVWSIKSECLGQFAVFGERHLEHLVAEYEDYITGSVRTKCWRTSRSGCLAPVASQTNICHTINHGTWYGRKYSSFWRGTARRYSMAKEVFHTSYPPKSPLSYPP